MGWTSSHSNSNLEGGTNPGGRSGGPPAAPEKTEEVIKDTFGIVEELYG